jgi:hypothetical protein
MAFGTKKPASARIGLKKQAHHVNRLGLKASNLAMSAGAVVALAGPEALPVASALEVAGGAGKAIFGLGSMIV